MTNLYFQARDRNSTSTQLTTKLVMTEKLNERKEDSQLKTANQEHLAQHQLKA
jgi:hypothetical protein